jgi:hypothetical protein
VELGILKAGVDLCQSFVGTANVASLLRQIVLGGYCNVEVCKWSAGS